MGAGVVSDEAKRANCRCSTEPVRSGFTPGTIASKLLEVVERAATDGFHVRLPTREDRRRFSRELRAAEAAIADASDPNREHYYALLSREHAVRAALGEMDDL